MSQAGDFNPVNMAAYTIFGAIGIAAFIYGKKKAFWRPMVIGIILMAYPYFLSGTLLIYLIGIVLTAALYFWRE
jgi:membrane-bound ClpP family serine protease